MMRIVRWCLGLVIAWGAFTGAAGQVSLEEALDGEGLVWTTGWSYNVPIFSNLPGWGGVETPAALDAMDAIRPMAPGETSETPWLRTKVTGPGVLRFHWKADGEVPAQSLLLMINGSFVPSLEVTSYWQVCEVALGEGEHDLQWTPFRSFSGVGTPFGMLMDQVSFSAGESLDVANAVSGSHLMLVSGPAEAPWVEESAITHDGVSAAASGSLLEDGQVTRISALVAGPGTLSFWGKVSSEEGKDQLDFRAGGYSRSVWSGEQDWFRFEEDLEIPSWCHWEYRKDASGSSGDDRAWIDDIQFVPAWSDDMAEGLDLTPGQGILGLRGDWPLTVVPEHTHDGEDAVERFYPDNSPFSVAVEGPGVLRVWEKREGPVNARVESSTYAVAGRSYDESIDPSGWQETEVVLQPGLARVQWSSNLVEGASWQIDQMRWLPPVSVNEGLDTELTLTQSEPNWVALSTRQSSDGADCVVSPPLGREYHEAWLEAEVSGPAWLGFMVHNTTNNLSCRLDGQLVTSLKDEYRRNEWRRFQVYVPPGNHRFRWDLEIAPTYSNSFAGTRLDALTVSPIDATNDLVTALNLPVDHVALSLNTGTLLAQSLVSRDGLAVQLAPREALSLTFEEVGVLEWWQRDDSSNSTAPYLWTRQERLVTSPGRAVELEAGTGLLFLDDMRFRPVVPLEAVLGGDLVYSTGGPKPILGYPSETNPVVRFAPDDTPLTFPFEITDIPVGGWLETEVEGPGVLRYNAQTYGARIEVRSKSGPSTYVSGGLRLFIDGEEAHLQFEPEPTLQQHAIPPGSHTIRWEYRGIPFADDDDLFGFPDVGFPVDGATLSNIEMLPGITLHSVLDVGEETQLHVSSEAPFVMDEDVWHAGGSSIRWPEPQDPLQIDLRVNGLGDGPTLVTFVSDSGYWDTAALFGAISSSPERSFLFKEGDWIYHAAYASTALRLSADPGLGEVRLDSLSVSQPIAVAEALDSDLTFTTSPRNVHGYRGALSTDGDFVSFSQDSESWIETTVEGPGVISFRFLETEIGSQVFVDGEIALPAQRFDGTQWTANVLSIPEGTHTVKWTYYGIFGDQAFLDQVQWTVGDGPVGALDWQLSGAMMISGDWQEEEDPFRVNESALHAPPTESARPTSVKVFPQDKGLLRFWAQGNGTITTRTSNYRDTELSFSSTGRWYYVPTFESTLMVEISFNITATEGARMDALSWTPEVSLSEALDHSELTFTTSGNSHGGANIGDAQDLDAVVVAADRYSSGNLETQVTGPGTLRFRWRLEGKSAVAKLNIDSSPVLTFGQRQVWQVSELVLGEGDHHLQWAPASSWTSGAFFWIDDLEMIPEDHPLSPFAPGSVSHSHDVLMVEEEGVVTYEVSPSGSLLLAFDTEGLHGLTVRSTVPSQLSVRVNGVYDSLSIDDTWQDLRFRLGTDDRVTLQWDHSETAAFRFRDVIHEEPLTTPPSSLDIWLGLEGVTTADDGASWQLTEFPSETLLQAGADSSATAPSWLEIPTDGATAIAFEWRGTSSEAVLLVDGEPRLTLPSTPHWDPIYLELPDDASTVRWQVSDSSPSMAQRASMRSLELLDTRTLRDAIDADPAWGKISTVGNGWHLTTEDTSDGEDALTVNQAGYTQVSIQWEGLPAGRLSFWAKTNGQHSLRVSGDLREQQTISASTWEPYDVLVPPDTTLWFAVYGGNGSVSLDRFEFVPAEDINAIDNVSELTLTPSESSTWLGMVTPNGHNDPNYLVSPVINRGEDVCLEAEITGPGLLSFAWQIPNSSPSNFFDLSIDGEAQTLGRWRPGWICHQEVIPPGNHTVRWQLASTYSNGIWLALDNLHFEPGEPTLLSQALDTSLNFRGGGTDCWHLTPDSQAPGGDDDVLRTTFDSSHYAFWLETSVDLNERSLVTWWARANDTPLPDSLFELRELQSLGNRLRVKSIDTRDDGWTRFAAILRPGLHKPWLSLPYYSAIDTTLNEIWFDDFQVTPVEAIALGEALDLPELLWQTNPEAPWQGERSPLAADGQDHAVASVEDLSFHPWLETTVTGPLELHFHWHQNGFRRLYVDQEVIAADHRESTNGTALAHCLLIPPGEHTIRWEASSGEHALDQIRLVPPHEGLSAALEWFPPSGGALITTIPGGLETALHDDGDLVLNLTSGEFTFTWLNPMEGRFVIDARRLPISDHPWTPDANIILENGSMTSQLPSQSYAWHPLEVITESPSSAITARLQVNSRNIGTHAQIARFSHWPMHGLTLSEALDSTLVFATHPDAPWTARSSAQSADGVDHAAASSLTTPSWLETMVEGPGQLHFWSRGDVEWQVNEVTFAGAPNDQPSEWVLQQMALPTGTHTIRWFKTSSHSALDQVSYAPTANLYTFDTWTLLNDLEGNEALPNADPNSDGLANLAAWAFGVTPTGGRDANAEARLPQGEVQATLLGDCLEMEFYRRVGSSATYLPQFGDSPVGPWEARYDVVEVEDLGNGWQRVRVRDRTTVPGPGRRFGQVEISDQ